MVKVKFNELMRELYSLEDEDRFKYIYNKVFGNCGYTDDPNSVFYSNYENTIWRERNLPLEETTFGQTVDLLDIFTVNRTVKNNNEIFPHCFKYKIYFSKEPRGKEFNFYFLTETEYLGEFPMMQIKKEHPISTIDLTRLGKRLHKELNRDPNLPLYVVWVGQDPRINGDYSSEVYEEVSFIGYEDEAEKHYQRMIWWSNESIMGYVSYPTKLEDKSLKKGDKRVIHPARNVSKAERWEIEHGY